MVDKELVQEAGGFRREYDGAQDHDLILRCAERLKREEIAHVDRILYHWRIHERSTAGDPGTKEYAHEAGRRAIEDHLRKKGRRIEVSETEHRGFYRVEYPSEAAKDRYSMQLWRRDNRQRRPRIMKSMAAISGGQSGCRSHRRQGDRPDGTYPLQGIHGETVGRIHAHVPRDGP